MSKKFKVLNGFKIVFFGVLFCLLLPVAALAVENKIVHIQAPNAKVTSSDGTEKFLKNEYFSSRYAKVAHMVKPKVSNLQSSKTNKQDHEFKGTLPNILPGTSITISNFDPSLNSDYVSASLHVYTFPPHSTQDLDFKKVKTYMLRSFKTQTYTVGTEQRRDKVVINLNQAPEVMCTDIRPHFAYITLAYPQMGVNNQGKPRIIEERIVEIGKWKSNATQPRHTFFFRPNYAVYKAIAHDIRISNDVSGRDESGTIFADLLKVKPLPRVKDRLRGWYVSEVKATRRGWSKGTFAFTSPSKGIVQGWRANVPGNHSGAYRLEYTIIGPKCAAYPYARRFWSFEPSHPYRGPFFKGRPTVGSTKRVNKASDCQIGYSSIGDPCGSSPGCCKKSLGCDSNNRCFAGPNGAKNGQYCSHTNQCSTKSFCYKSQCKTKLKIPRKTKGGSEYRCSSNSECTSNHCDNHIKRCYPAKNKGYKGQLCINNFNCRSGRQCVMKRSKRYGFCN